MASSETTYQAGDIVEVVRNPVHVARGLQEPQWVRTQVEAVPVGHSEIRANGERQVFVRIDGILVNRAVRDVRQEMSRLIDKWPTTTIGGPYSSDPKDRVFEYAPAAVRTAAYRLGTHPSWLVREDGRFDVQIGKTTYIVDREGIIASEEV